MNLFLFQILLCNLETKYFFVRFFKYLKYRLVSPLNLQYIPLQDTIVPDAGFKLANCCEVSDRIVWNSIHVHATIAYLQITLMGNVHRNIEKLLTLPGRLECIRNINLRSITECFANTMLGLRSV